MKLRATNHQIVRFRQMADAIITNLSKNNKRSRYLSAMQRMYDALEDTMKSIQKKERAIMERYARVDPDTNCFVFNAQGGFTYVKDQQLKLTEELEEFSDTARTITLDIPEVMLTKDDLPKDGQGNLSITNQLLKDLTPFVITPELRDEIIYGIIEVPEEKLKIAEN